MSLHAVGTRFQTKEFTRTHSAILDFTLKNWLKERSNDVRNWSHKNVANFKLVTKSVKMTSGF